MLRQLDAFWGTINTKLTIPRALVVGAIGGAAAMWVVLSWRGETSEQADERVARALCEQILPVDRRDFIPACTRQTLAKLQFERRMKAGW
jgi:hypothetical protein